MPSESADLAGIYDSIPVPPPSAAPPLTLSVIIPALNEAEHLPALLEALCIQRDLRLEVIVSDGESSDGTPALAAAAGAIVVTAPRGRAVQMNAGARRAQGEYLLFLHADSGIDDPTLLQRAVAALARRLATVGHHRVAGHFRLCFRRRTQGHRLAFRYLEEKTALNRPYTINGDQGFLLARRYFEELGGFAESLPFLEDQRLAKRIRADGEWITLPGRLQTSGRRFETEGFHRRYLLMAIIMGLHYAEVEAFFLQAPAVYRAQHETSRLLLTPFLRCIRQVLRARKPRDRWYVWLRAGRFARQNSWQLFFFLDVLARRLLGPGRYPATAFHDQVFWPLTHFRVFDAVTAVLLFFWVMGVLQFFFWLWEWRDLGHG